jgi:hypothetical protein
MPTANVVWLRGSGRMAVPPPRHGRYLPFFLSQSCISAISFS